MSRFDRASVGALSLHPQDGARFLLERESVSDDGHRAFYRATIFTVAERFEYAAELAADGSLELEVSGAGGGAAAAELEARLDKIARSTARAAERQRAAGLPRMASARLALARPGARLRRQAGVR